MTIEANVSLRILTPRHVLEGSGNPNALENINPSQLPDGCLCWVISEAALYRYEAEGIESRAYPDIIPTCYGEGTKGRWRRTIQDAAPSTSVNCCATADVNLLAPVVSFDTHVLVDNDRVLLPFQTDQTENGIYSWDAISGLLTRAADFDAGEEFVPGLIVSVTQGDQYLGADFRLVNTGAVVLGVTDILFGLSSGILLVDRFGVPIARHDQLQVFGALVGSAGQANTIDLYWLDVREFGASPSATPAANRAAVVAAIEASLGIPAGYLDDPTKGDAGYVNATRPTKVVWIPEAYTISSGFTIRYQGVTLLGTPSSVQGGQQGNGSMLVCDFDGDAFLLYTGAAGEFAGARDLSVKGICIKRAPGHTGTAAAVDGGTWTSGLALDGSRITGHTIGVEIKASYNNPAFARLTMQDALIDNCGTGIETNGKHLSNSYIPWGRITQCSTSGFHGGLTGSVIGQVDFEGQPSPVIVEGTNSYAFEIGPLYFENNNLGAACLNIILARDFLVKDIQTSGAVSIPLVRVQTAQNGKLPGHDVVCVGAVDCTLRSILVPATGHEDDEFAAAWVMSHGSSGVQQMPRLPWACQGEYGPVFTEVADFGSATLAATRVGTPGTPSSRVNAFTFSLGSTLQEGDVALLAWAVRYDAGRGGLSSASNITVQGRRTLDLVYEDIGSLNVDNIMDVGIGDVVQFITAWRVVTDGTHAPPYNAFRIYFYPYGTDVGDVYYDALVSPFLFAELDGATDLLVPPFDVPTLIKSTIGETRLDPPQLTASVNNWAPGIVPGVDAVYISADAPWNITGFAAVAGASFWLINNGAQAITLKHNDGASAVGNKVLCATGADIVIAPGGMVRVYRDNTANTYRAVA